MLFGVELLDKNYRVLVKAGWCQGTYKKSVCREFSLEEGERIVGVKSKIDKVAPRQLDVVFVIGREE